MSLWLHVELECTRRRAGPIAVAITRSSLKIRSRASKRCTRSTGQNESDSNFAYRQAIRETWASQTDLPRDVKVFFVGCSRVGDIYNTDERERIEKAIELEKQTYGDLLTHELDCEIRILI
ncbi:hypothetical protein GQ600_27127 [Phytophthora cactorum]|nr:hypothetical protein GQ600_27127 [Phytophthora cactorum]